MALYNNGYPATFQQYYPGFQQNMPVLPQNNVQNQQNGKIWVIGEAGAKSYLVAPNSTVDLWDSEAPVIYLKSADATGLPSMKILDYTVRESNKNQPNLSATSKDESYSNFATKDEIRCISDQITALRKRVDKLMKEDDDE